MHHSGIFRSLKAFRNWLRTSLPRGTGAAQGHGGSRLLVLEAYHSDVSKLRWKLGSFISLPAPLHCLFSCSLLLLNNLPVQGSAKTRRRKTTKERR